MGICIPRHGIILVCLCFGLAQIQTAYGEAFSPPINPKQPRVAPLDHEWEAVSYEEARIWPASSAVRLTMYNKTRLLTNPVGVGPWAMCSGFVISWNMVVTAAHCFHDEHGYMWELASAVPGGPATPVQTMANGAFETASLSPFGSYDIDIPLQVWEYPGYDRTKLGGQEILTNILFDLAVVRIAPIKRAAQYADSAKMKLNMLGSTAVDAAGQTYQENIVNAAIRHFHFPGSYPMWLKGWARMHRSFVSNMQMISDGHGIHQLYTLPGSSGSGILVLTDENTGKLRAIHVKEIWTKDQPPVRHGAAVALSPAQIRWIAGVMHAERITDLNTMDQDLSPGLETEMCMCRYPDAGNIVTLEVIAFYDDCECATDGAAGVVEPVA